VSFLSGSIFIRKEQRQREQSASRRNSCPEWSREVSAAWSRVGFSTSRPYILIIIVAQSLDANGWTHLNPLKRLRMRRERQRGRAGGRAGRKEGRWLSRVLCKNAQTSVFGDNSRLVASSHPLDSPTSGVCRPLPLRRSFPRPFRAEAG